MEGWRWRMCAHVLGQRTSCPATREHSISIPHLRPLLDQVVVQLRAVKQH